MVEFAHDDIVDDDAERQVAEVESEMFRDASDRYLMAKPDDRIDVWDGLSDRERELLLAGGVHAPVTDDDLDESTRGTLTDSFTPVPPTDETFDEVTAEAASTLRSGWSAVQNGRLLVAPSVKDELLAILESSAGLPDNLASEELQRGAHLIEAARDAQFAARERPHAIFKSQVPQPDGSVHFIEESGSGQVISREVVSREEADEIFEDHQQAIVAAERPWEGREGEVTLAEIAEWPPGVLGRFQEEQPKAWAAFEKEMNFQLAVDWHQRSAVRGG